MSDDPAPAVQMVNGVPGYALDQFTRRGNAVARALFADSPDLAILFNKAGIRPANRVQTLGDLIFLTEGSAVANRVNWRTGDELREPHRCLLGVARLSSYLDESVRLVDAKLRQIEILRAEQLTLISLR